MAVNFELKRVDNSNLPLFKGGLGCSGDLQRDVTKKRFDASSDVMMSVLCENDCSSTRSVFRRVGKSE